MIGFAHNSKSNIKLHIYSKSFCENIFDNETENQGFNTGSKCQLL